LLMNGIKWAQPTEVFLVKILPVFVVPKNASCTLRIYATLLAINYAQLTSLRNSREFLHSFELTNSLELINIYDKLVSATLASD
jgi:hypothetical protein